jgi:hypothetical protein
MDSVKAIDLAAGDSVANLTEIVRRKFLLKGSFDLVRLGRKLEKRERIVILNDSTIPVYIVGYD